MKFLIELLLFCIPRYTTEEVALKANETLGRFDIVCSMCYILPDEKYDAIAVINVFTWFWYRRPILGEAVSIRPWPEANTQGETV